MSYEREQEQAIWLQCYSKTGWDSKREWLSENASITNGTAEDQEVQTKKNMNRGCGKSLSDQTTKGW